MKMFVKISPVISFVLTGCSIMQAQDAMERNRCAIQRSTKAIEKNVEALDRVTKNLKEMQQ